MSKSQFSDGSDGEAQPTPTAHKSGMTRRDLLRRSAVGIGTVGAVSTGAVRLDAGPVGEAEAVAPLVVAGGAAALSGGSAATGWLLREYEVVGSNPPAEGTTINTLENDVLNTMMTRKDTNGESITDNKNIINGLEHVAYSEGKIAAIDQLNDQESQSEVQDAALEVAMDEIARAQDNFLSTWNQSLTEVAMLYDMIDEHPDEDGNPVAMENNSDWNHIGEGRRYSEEIELADGSTKEIEFFEEDAKLHPVDGYARLFWRNDRSNTGLESDIEYCDSTEWSEIWEMFEEMQDELNDGLIMWVDGVYEDVQAGELDTEDLLTPRELAEMTSDDEDFSQAVSDLMALNVSVDLEREAEIYLDEVGATVYGSLATTGDDSLSTGTVDPDDRDDSIYLTYDISQGQGEWDAYVEGLDGGVLTFTQEPFPETIYYVDTTAGETAEITADDFDETEDGDYEADLSNDLYDSITNVEQIEFYAEVEETQYETVQLQTEFEIIRFTDSDGEEYDEASFERTETQDNENYITEEEWQDQQERHEELIEIYEESQQGGTNVPGVEEVLTGDANEFIGLVVVGFFVVSAIFSALNPLS